MNNKLIKIMIVDDEYHVRNHIKKCIDWNKIGMEIVAEASSAPEAMDIVREIHPNIIITDIYMPYIDGIEFARRVMEQYPDIKVTVLTGYDEFEYAKRSIKVGISDFILKPVNEEEIMKAVLKVKEKIFHEEEQKKDYLRIKKQLEDNKPCLIEKFFHDLINGKVDKVHLEEKLNYYGIEINEKHFQIAVIEADYPEREALVNEEEQLILNMQVTDAIKYYFKDDGKVYVFSDSNKRIVVLCNNKSVDLTECCENINCMIINGFKCHMNAGIGNSYNTVEKVRFSYVEAIEALEFKVFIGRNQVIVFRDIDISTKEKIEVEKEQIEKLCFYIKAGFKEKSGELIDDIFSYNINAGKEGIESIRIIASCIMSTIFHMIMNIGLQTDEIFKKVTQPYEMIYFIKTLPEMKKFILDISNTVIDEVNRIKSSMNNDIINNIKQYIQDNISDEKMSLSTIAKVYFMNSSYLSRMFKAETGKNFIEYLSEVRMKKAMDLLDSTNLRSYQIAEKIGFSDPNYFSTCFKKYSGVTVNDYKSLKNKKS